MAREMDEVSAQSEARRNFSDHYEDEGDEAIGGDESHVAEEKSRSRSEGLDTLKSYLREIRRSTLLTFKQEQQLGKRVMAGDEQARQQMIESNLRLVISIGKRYIHRGFPFSDIVERAVEDVIFNLQQGDIEARLTTLRRRISEAQELGDEGIWRKLIEEQKALLAERDGKKEIVSGRTG